MAAVSAESRRTSKARHPARQAAVTTTARLHFGFLDPSGRGKRPFGSFGLSLDRPTTRIMLERADRFEASGPECERGLRYLRSIAASSGRAAFYRLKIEEAIPPHAGLGSGTQLALAVGSAFAALEDLRLDAQEIAARLGRGASVRHRHRHLRPRRRCARQWAAPRRVAAARQPPPLPRRMARASDLRCQFERARRGERDGRLRARSPTFRRSEADRAASADHGERDAGACGARLRDVLRRGRAFASCHGRLFRAAARRDPMRAPESARRSTGCAVKASADLARAHGDRPDLRSPRRKRKGRRCCEACAQRFRHRGLSFELAQGRNEGAKIETTASEIQ